MMIYRATPHGSSQCSPNLLMLARETELPIDLMVGKTPDSEDHSNRQAEYVLRMRDRMETAHRYAREQMKKSAVRQKRNYDHNSKGRKF